MDVLKIELEGLTTSFRYPHFLVGRQPSFTMPPPSTIYGHIASALGDYPDPESFRFAYAFTHAGKVDDFEHTYMIAVDRTKKRGWEHPSNISASLNPTLRQMFFRPQLTLYLATPNLEHWQAAFRAPRYPVALGRSQDLASYRSVRGVSLERSNTGYVENTLLPWSYRPYVRLGEGVLMPRLIDPSNRENVTWARYVTLEHRIFRPHEGETLEASLTLHKPEAEVWTDPQSPEVRGYRRALVWHSLTGSDNEVLDAP